MTRRPRTDRMRERAQSGHAPSDCRAFQLEAPEPGDSERLKPYDLTDIAAALDPLNTPWPRGATCPLYRSRLRGVELFADPSLIAPPRGRLKSPMRRITRRNGAPT